MSGQAFCGACERPLFLGVSIPGFCVDCGPAEDDVDPKPCADCDSRILWQNTHWCACCGHTVCEHCWEKHWFDPDHVAWLEV